MQWFNALFTKPQQRERQISVGDINTLPTYTFVTSELPTYGAVMSQHQKKAERKIRVDCLEGAYKGITEMEIRRMKTSLVQALFERLDRRAIMLRKLLKYSAAEGMESEMENERNHINVEIHCLNSVSEALWREYASRTYGGRRRQIDP